MFARTIITLALCAVSVAAQSATKKSTPPEAEERRRIVHALSRLTWGPTRELVTEVERKGYTEWLDEQLAKTGLSQEMSERLAELDSLGMTCGEIRAAFGDGRRDIPRRQLVTSVFLRAAGHDAQVAEVMADFWRNHLNVDVNKDSVGQSAVDYDREVIRKHVFGKFPDMLMASARHPAMLVYLDNHLSRRPPNKVELEAIARRVREKTGSRERGEEAQKIAEQSGLNENYARELLELHTLGVDNGYTQKDVVHLAKALTGWTIDREKWVFEYRDDMHLHEQKFLMGKGIPRMKRRDGHVEGEWAIERLSRHGKTATFLAHKMCTRLVADQPPRKLVTSTAAVLRKTGFDLGAATRHIATSKEFFDPKHRRALFKTPLEFVVSCLRVCEAEIDRAEGLRRRIAEMGQPVYECEDPTGYRDVAESWRDPGVMALRWSFAIDLVCNRVQGVHVPETIFEEIDGLDDGGMIDRLGERVMPGGLRAETRATVRRVLAKIREPYDEDLLKKRRKYSASVERITLGVLLGSPEFQEQ